MKFFNASGLGGSPVRSRVSLRSNRLFSVSAEAESPTSFHFLLINASMGVEPHEGSSSGISGFTGGSKAQWVLYSAPWATQRLRISFSKLPSIKFDSGGGIISEASSL